MLITGKNLWTLNRYFKLNCIVNINYYSYWINIEYYILIKNRSADIIYI